MGYMVGKKLAVLLLVVVTTIAAAKGRIAPPPPPAVPEDCAYYIDTLGCMFTDLSVSCCDLLDKAYHQHHSCLCTYFITDDASRRFYLANFASCKISVPNNVCMPGENSGNSDKTVLQKTTSIAVSTLLGFLLF